MISLSCHPADGLTLFHTETQTPPARRHCSELTLPASLQGCSSSGGVQGPAQGPKGAMAGAAQEGGGHG